jgi:hypothetical protein
MKKQTAAAVKTKAKKATAGEQLLMRVAGYSLTEVRVYQPMTAKAIDRAIAAAVRKAVKAEREEIVKIIARRARDVESDRESACCEDLLYAINARTKP